MSLDVTEWKGIVVGIFSGAFIPYRVSMEDGEVSDFTPYENLDEWRALVPRADDNVVGTPKGQFIIPKVVVCKYYDKVPVRKLIFPTKRNIWARDNYICQYTGKRLEKSELSIDHVIPKSRGGKDSWENLVTCDRMLNSWKTDRTPEECEPPLELLFSPTKPKNGIVIDQSYEEVWSRITNV